MKHKIMEVLLSGDNNLTKDEINWAISNIPNDATTTTNHDSVIYDHTADNIWDACGFTDEKLKNLAAEYSKLREDSPGSKKSHFIEYLFNNASSDLVKYFCIKGIQAHEQKAHDRMLEDLKALIDKLGK